MANKRKRKRFNFWLDDNDETDMEIIHSIKKMKKSRSFTQSIRDGLRLLQSLANGETKLLFEMFPSIRKTLYAQMEADVIERYNVAQSNEVIQHIVELRGIVTQIQNQPVLAAPMQGTMTLRKVTHEEEMTLEVTKPVVSSGNAAQNFLSSMMALQAPQAKKEPVQIQKPAGLKSLSAASFAPPTFDDE